MNLPPITIEQMIAELDRELMMRHRVYPRQVSRGQLKQATAQHQIRVINALLAKLRAEQKEGPLFRQQPEGQTK